MKILLDPAGWGVGVVLSMTQWHFSGIRSIRGGKFLYMATCCCQLCPRITSYSGWPVSGHGKRNALSFPLTFRSPYFLFHSAWRKIEGVRGGCEEREAGGPGRGVWGAEGAGLDRTAAPQTLQQQHECQGRPPQPVHNYCFKNKKFPLRCQVSTVVDYSFKNQENLSQ